MTQMDQHVAPVVPIERSRRITIRDLIIALAHVEDALRRLPPDHPATAQLLLRQEAIVGALHRHHKGEVGSSPRVDEPPRMRSYDRSER